MSNSRRNFIKNAALGASGIGLSGFFSKEKQEQKNIVANSSRKPREVWIATMTQHLMSGDTLEDVSKAAIRQMENALAYTPDIICLPEVFHAVGVNGGMPPLEISSEDGSGNIIGPFQEFANENKCYVICSVYTTEDGKYFNAAVVIDREGKKIGEYRKIRLTEGELNNGLTPGPLDPPVFQTDFGTIGIQICFDIFWADAWNRLGEKGAEIVFWPSAFAGGKMVNTKAWENQYCVVSSTRKDTTRICEVTGEELAASGIWDRWGVCAPVNLEKIFMHSYPIARKFPEIQKKYGQKVRIYSLHEEEFSIIESLSEEVKIADLVQEFGLKTHREYMRSANDHMNRLGYRG